MVRRAIVIAAIVNAAGELDFIEAVHASERH
jgi:hypothetical protein